MGPMLKASECVPDSDSTSESDEDEKQPLQSDRDAWNVGHDPEGSNVSFLSSWHEMCIVQVNSTVGGFLWRIWSFFSRENIRRLASSLREIARSFDLFLRRNVRPLDLLLWKNVWLLGCKRHYLVTLLNIGLPLILTIIFCIVNARFIPTEADAESATSFPIFDEMKLLKRLCNQTEFRKCVVAYEPKTEFTTSIVNQTRDLYHHMLQLDEDEEILEWKGFNSELEIQAYWISPEQNASVELKAAILFQEGFNISTENYANFSYTILIPDVTNDPFVGFFPQATKRSISEPYDTTASALQILVEKVLTVVLTKVEAPKEKFQILLQAFPRLPAPIRNTQIFGRYFSTLFPLLLSLGFIVTVPFVIGPIVQEKESGMRELMHVHGLPNWANWFGWLLYSMLFQLVTIAIVLGLLFIPFNSVVGGIVKRGSFWLWAIALGVYCIAATSWCILISSFFYDPTIAVSVGAFLWLGTYLFLAASPFYRLSLPWKLVLSLFPNLALSFCTELLLEFDERLEGANWGIFFTPKSDVDSFTVGYALIEMLLSSILYNLFAFYFESIISPKLGVRKPWNFIFKYLFRGNSIKPRTNDAYVGKCVELRKLKKTIGEKDISYGESHTFKRGEITVLYGTNGSGKTTLLSILAGLIAPSTGTAYVNGIDVTQDINSVRQSLGYCPQSNILFADLTVEEHLIFFGMLKWRPKDDMPKPKDNTIYNTEEILCNLHLNDKKDVLSCYLSGGQKRKLNLGMAAMGRPKLLLLDEPTSGVDLESRCSIRTFLLEYHRDSGEDAVVLMTSHLLEDSEPGRYSRASKVVVVTDEGLQPEFPSVNVLPSRLSETAPPSKLSRVDLVVQQFGTLMWKHILYAWRQKPLLLIQIFLPLVLAILTAVCAIQVREGYSRTEFSNFVRLEEYRDWVTLYSTDDVSRTKFNNFTSLRKYGAKETQNVTTALVEVGEKNIEEYQQHYVVAAEFSAESEQELIVKAMFSLTNPSAVSEAINLASHVILRKINGDKNQHIKVSVNRLVPNWAPAALDAADPSPKLVTWISVVTSIVLPLGLAFLAASFVVMPVKERASKVKQLQLMTGLNAFVYWGAFFSWDILVTAAVSGLLVLCLRLLGTNTDTEGEGVLVFMLLTYGLAAIFFSYWMSLKFSNASLAFVVVTIIHMVSGTIGTAAIITLQTLGLVNFSFFVSLILHIFPAFGISVGVALFSEVQSSNGRCNSIDRTTRNSLCNPNNTFDLGYRSCCPRCQIDFTGSTCFQPQPYIQWHSVHRMGHPHLHETGIGQQLVYMLALSGFYVFLLAIVECRLLFTPWRAVCSFYASQRVQGGEYDGSTEGSASECGIEVKDLCKSYGSVKAISSLNFRAPQKERINLVGHNGAGKSTLFRILTGDELPSTGSVYIDGKSLESDAWGFNLISKERLSKIGYCPQFEGLIGTLTGKEMLGLFARLWGRSPTHSIRIAMEWMDRLGLKDYENMRCSTYSGGMQRRLSVAIALIGNPAVAILDEPYTGVSFEARKLVSEVIRKCEQSVIVSTHDLKDCETFASILTFMKNGKLVESSSVENLKEKYRNAIEVYVEYAYTHVEFQLRLQIIARELGGAVQSVWTDETCTPIKERLLLALCRSELRITFMDDDKQLENIYLNLVSGSSLVTCFEFKGQERRWMEQKFDEISNQNTLGGDACTLPKSKTSVAPSVSRSFTSRPSLVIKLSNHLSCDLTSPQVHMINGTIQRELENVSGCTSKWFKADGDGTECSLLLSVRISEALELRLTAYCFTNLSGSIHLCIAFTREGVPMDDSLKNILCSSTPALNAWSSGSSRGPVEGYIRSNRFLARASMTLAPMCEVRIEIVGLDKLEEKITHLGSSTIGEQSRSFHSQYEEKTKLIHITENGKVIPVGHLKTDVEDTFTVKLTNYLKSTLKVQARYGWESYIDIVPAEVASRTARHFRFAGNAKAQISVRVTEDTSFYLFAERRSSGFMLIGGFCPDDEPQTTSDEDYEAEDIRRSLRFEPCLCPARYESFVNNRELLGRVHVAEGDGLELQVAVLDISDGSKRPIRAQQRRLPRIELDRNVHRFNGNISYHYYLLWTLLTKLEKFKIPYAGIIDLENRLDVSLSSENGVEMYPIHYTFWNKRVPLPEVLAFTRETFYESGPTAFKAIVSYKIESTDLGLVIAFQVQDENNLFSVALVPSSDVVTGSSLDSMLDPAERRIQKANEGEQIVRDGDIRVRVSMTEGRRSILSLRIDRV